MKRLHLYILILIFANACESKTETRKERTQKAKTKTVNAGVKIAETKVSIDVEKEELVLDERTLFGKFHQDRVEFYVDEQPNLSFNDAIVQSRTLYFIDGVLCKKKYLLEEDISSKLIDQYGPFTFKPLDWDTREAADVLDVILTNASLKTINPVLMKYKLRWRLDSATIKYRHEQDSLLDLNIYEEEMPAYRNLLKSAERGLI